MATYPTFAPGAIPTSLTRSYREALIKGMVVSPPWTVATGRTFVGLKLGTGGGQSVRPTVGLIWPRQV